jgi:upstream activation factor subunit UAF30
MSKNNNINDKHFNDLLSELDTLKISLLNNIKTIKNLQTQVKKTLQKTENKRAKELNKKKRSPSGFAKPCLISKELCTFLNVSQGTEMARTEVTKKLTEYIKTNSLQNPQNKRIILPDSKLNKLLGTSKGDDVTYFNLQKYMKVHFPKTQ